MSKKKKNIILENIKLITAAIAKGVAVGKTEEGKLFWFLVRFRVM